MSVSSEVARTQYDDHPLIMTSQQADFRAVFLTGCMMDPETCNPVHGDGYTSTVTYVHDASYDENPQNAPILKDLAKVAATSEFKGRLVTTFFMPPYERSRRITSCLSCRLVALSDSFTQYSQVPPLVVLMLSSRPVLDVQRALPFWPSTTTNQLQLTATGVSFGAPGRKSQGLCLPRCAPDKRQPVRLELKGLTMALYMVIQSHLIKWQVPTTCLDGLLHTTMHAVVASAGPSLALFRMQRRESEITSGLRSSLVRLAEHLRDTIGGRYEPRVVDPLFRAAAKRANRMHALAASTVFSAMDPLAKQPVECTRRLWRPRTRMALSDQGALIQLARHSCFQPTVEFGQFMLENKNVKIVQVAECAAATVCTALIRYMPRAAFFLTDYCSTGAHNPTTLVAMSEDALWTYDRASAIRFVAEMRSSRASTIKSTVEWDFYALAPMLTGMAAGNDRTPLTSRVLVDTLREWLGLSRLPSFNSALLDSKRQAALTERCTQACTALLALASAPSMRFNVAIACMTALLAVLEGGADGLRVRKTLVEVGTGDIDERVIKLARDRLRTSIGGATTSYAIEGLPLWAELCALFISGEECNKIGRTDDAKGKHVHYLEMLAHVEYVDAQGHSRTLRETLQTDIEFSTGGLEGLKSKSTSPFTLARLSAQLKGAALVERRTGLATRCTPSTAHRLFLLIAYLEQQQNCGAPQRLVLPDFVKLPELDMSHQEFVENMVLKEPQLAVRRITKTGCCKAWYAGEQFCTWTIDRETDGGLHSQHYDINDRASFFHWRWDPIVCNTDWIGEGITVYNNRQGDRLFGEYDSDDEMARDAAAATTTAFAEYKLETPATSQPAAAAAAAAATQEEVKIVGRDDFEDQEEEGAAAEDQEEEASAGDTEYKPQLSIFDVIDPETDEDEREAADPVKAAWAPFMRSAAAAAATKPSAASPKRQDKDRKRKSDNDRESDDRSGKRIKNGQGESVARYYGRRK